LDLAHFGFALVQLLDAGHQLHSVLKPGLLWL
jgi:hypothetical protein